MKKNSLEEFVNILTNYDFIGEIEKCPKSTRPFMYKQLYEMYEKEKERNKKYEKKNNNN